MEGNLRNRPQRDPHSLGSADTSRGHFTRWSSSRHFSQVGSCREVLPFKKPTPR